MFFEVLARTECLLSGPADHDRARLNIAPGFSQRVVELLFHFLVERVIDLRTVQRDGADAIGYIVQQRLERGHRSDRIWLSDEGHFSRPGKASRRQSVKVNAARSCARIPSGGVAAGRNN